MVRSRDIDVLIKTESTFFKTEVDTKTYKMYFFGIRQSCRLYTYILFKIGAKSRNFVKKCKFWFTIFYTLWVAMFSKNYTATTCTKIKIFWNFDKNAIIFTLDFAVQVRSLIWPDMTSSVSNDVIFFHKTIKRISS